MKKTNINTNEAYGYPTYLAFNVHVFKKENKETGQFEDNVDMMFIAESEEKAIKLAKYTIKRPKGYKYRVFQLVHNFFKKDIKEMKITSVGSMIKSRKDSNYKEERKNV